MTLALVILATALAPALGCGIGWLITHQRPAAPDPWAGWDRWDGLDVDDRY